MNPPESRLEYEPASPRQSRLGLALLVTAVITAALCIALLTGARDDYLRLGLAAGFGLLTWALAKAGQRRRIPVLHSVDALRRLAKRTEIPVAIYLRRFVDDQQVDHPPAAESSVHDSDEIDLAQSFSRNCLFVAVGRPQEPLPPWGAYRLYLDDDEWEEKVAEIISMASVIFVKWADSEPLKKEMQLIEASSKLNRTMFLLPMLESTEDLYHYLPEGALFELEAPEEPDDQRYAAFFTTTASGKKLHYRDRKLGYGEAARKAVVDSFGMTDLSKDQQKVMKGFYGRFENLVSKGLAVSLYGFAAASALGMLLVASALIVGLLEDYIPSRVEDFVYLTLENTLEPVGWVLIISLGLFILLAVLVQRAMP